MFHLLVFFIILSLYLIIVLAQTKRSLIRAEDKIKRFSVLQKSFTSAVAGMEENLESEKIHAARMLHALENLTVGVAILDLDGRVQYCNSALWRVYGIDFSLKDNYLRKPWLKFHTEKGQEQIRRYVQPEIERKGYWHGDTDLMRQDGVLIRANMFISGNDEGFIGFVRDISEQYNAEGEVKKLQAALQHFQKSDAVERVLRALIHEFNNGLSSIIGFSEMLSEDLSKGSSEYHYADRINNTGRQLHGLIENARLLLPSSRTDSNVHADIIKVLATTTGEIARNVSIPYKIRQDVEVSDALVACDAYRLGQTIYHIIENAIEADGNRNEITVSVKSHVHVAGKIHAPPDRMLQFHEITEEGMVRLCYGMYDPQRSYIRLQVRDQGKGIPSAIIDNIFDPFFTSKNNKRKSAGLGMAIVRAFVRQYSGYVLIESVVDKGTLVDILLPVRGAPVAIPATTTEVPSKRLAAS